MPRSVIVRRPPERGTGDHEAEIALRSLRPWLQPGDEAENLAGFITLAAGRAFPETPPLEGSDLSFGYSWSRRYTGEYIDSNSPDDVKFHLGGNREYRGPVLLLAARSHDRIELRTAAEYVHRHSPTLAFWFLQTLARLPWWIYGPHEWRGMVEMAFWMGEPDEKEAIACHGLEETPEQFPFCTKAQLDRALPAWAWRAIRSANRVRYTRKHRAIRSQPPVDPVLNLRRAAQLAELGIDITGLLTSTGTFHSSHPRLAPMVPADTIDHPFRFFWTQHDWFEKALDEQLETAGNAGMGTEAFAWLPARDPKRCAADYEAATGPLLLGLSRLFESLRAFEKKHSPLLAKRDLARS